MDENGCIDMQWPSKRIAPGGLFHQPKVQYSPETRKMLKVLMDEAKLTLMQRKQMDWCLRSGSSLMDLSKEDTRERGDQNTTVIRPKTSRRRSYSVIKNSGDLEREIFRPTKRCEDREVIKKHLQDVMEFGKNEDGRPPIVNLKILKPTEPKGLPTKMDILHELLTQIQDREEWLQEMEDLGEGAKHREVIYDQIAERVRKIESLNALGADCDSNRPVVQTRGEGGKKSETASKSQQPGLDGFKNISEKRTGDSIINILYHAEGKTDSTPGSSMKRNESLRVSSVTPQLETRESNENGCTHLNRTVSTTSDSDKQWEDVKIKNLKKIYDKMNKDDLLGEDNLRGFSLEGSPCVSAVRSRTLKTSAASSRSNGKGKKKT